MGEYANFNCAGLTLYSFKNEGASRPMLMEAFVPSDLIREPGDDDPYRYIGFRTTCGAARRRLDVLGYTLERAYAYCRDFAERFLCRHDDPYEEFDPLPVRVPDEGFDWREAVAALKSGEDLLSAYGQLFDNGRVLAKHFHEIAMGAPLPFLPCNSYAALLIRTGAERPYVSVVDPEVQDPIWDLRIMLECVEPDAPLEYDFTYVANYWDDEAESKLLKFLDAGPYRRSAGVFLFTEGVNDDEFIHGAFNLLRPDVAPLFKSFGFHDDARPERGASALARLAQALASAGFDERCLFLFDNDAVGRKCLRGLNKLPANMGAICLPDVELAGRYPTIGPNDVEEYDLNGRGVAIEFFLGEDCLRRDEGSLRPAQWASREGDDFQANFPKDDKEAIHGRYRQALDDAKDHDLASARHDWSTMELLLEWLCESASALAPSTNQLHWLD